MLPGVAGACSNAASRNWAASASAPVANSRFASNSNDIQACGLPSTVGVRVPANTRSRSISQRIAAR